MLHSAIFLGTCNATMTTEKRCKLQRRCHRFAILFATCNAPAGNYLQLSGRHLKNSREQKTLSDWLILTQLRCRLRLICHMQQLVSQRWEKFRIVPYFPFNSQRNILLHFRLQKGDVTREIFHVTCNATFVATQAERKIAPCNMAFMQTA